jgi:hypothetical protein
VTPCATQVLAQKDNLFFLHSPTPGLGQTTIVIADQKMRDPCATPSEGGGKFTVITIDIWILLASVRDPFATPARRDPFRGGE